jgi:membrane-associated phospholipid phosphatase
VSRGKDGAVIAIGDFDDRMSNWAGDRHPVFGSRSGAGDFSDIGKNVLIAEAFGTALLTPSGAEPGEWALAKIKGIGVEGGGLLLTAYATSELKDAFGRDRPDDSNDNSMPSAHASAAFGSVALANRNLDHMEMNRHLRTGAKVANIALASSVAWARVEGEKHFPTDVLVGAALGNFLTRFVHDAFMGLDEDDRFSFYIEGGPDGAKAFVSWDF